MSLHTLAQHMQAAGRGDDKVLVHMTPKEVGGLQALARAHGGSLTINPHTGLPEAGFLSSLLPMLAGVFLGPAGLGLSAMQAGLATGALGTLATGSLGKGLMMGLGAYGGAGLGAGLAEAGTAAVPNAAAPSAANEALKASMYNPATGTTGGIFANPTMGATTPGISSLPATTPTPYSVISANPAGMVSPGVPAPTVTPAVDATIRPTLAGVNTTAGTVAEQAAQQAAPQVAPQSAMDKLGAGVKKSFSSWDDFKKLGEAAEKAAPYSKYASLGSTALGSYYDQQEAQKEAAEKAAKANQGLIRPYEFTRTQNPVDTLNQAPMWSLTPPSTAERSYFTESWKALTPYKAPGPEYATGGPIETMSAENAVGDNLNYPQSQLQTPYYSNPMVQRPVANNVINMGVDTNVDPYTGEQRMADGGKTDSEGTGFKYSYNPETLQFTRTGSLPKPSGNFGTMIQDVAAMNEAKKYEAMPAVTGGIATYGPAPSAPAAPAQSQLFVPTQVPEYQTPEQQLGLGAFYANMDRQLSAMGYAGGGLSSLGSYSDGGRLLKGPGDGVSDSIPAVIGDRQPARLADGEFVVPARIVSELGNGSTEAGARKLYAMMDRVQKARRKTVGKDKVAENTGAEKYLPA